MQCACGLLYRRLWLVWLYHNSHKRYDFQIKAIGHKMCVFDSLYFLIWKCLIVRSIQRDIIINVFGYSCKVPVILIGILTKIELSRQIVEKYKNVKFHENSSNGSRVFPCGQADRRTDGRTDRRNDINLTAFFEILRKHLKISVSFLQKRHGFFFNKNPGLWSSGQQSLVVRITYGT